MIPFYIFIACQLTSVIQVSCKVNVKKRQYCSYKKMVRHTWSRKLRHHPKNHFSKNVSHHQSRIKFEVRSQRTSSYVLAHSSLIKTLFKILRQKVQYQHRFKGKKTQFNWKSLPFFLFTNFQNGRMLYIPRLVGGLVTIVRKIHIVVGLILFTNPIELAVSEKNPRKTPFFGHCIGQPPPSIWKIPKQKKNTAWLNLNVCLPTPPNSVWRRM